MNPQARNKATTLRWTQLGNTTAIEAKLYECECESVGGQRILVHLFLNSVFTPSKMETLQAIRDLGDQNEIM